MNKLLVYDYNGVILADTLLTVTLDNEIFRELGLPEITLKEFQERFQFPIEEFFVSCGMDRQEYQQKAEEIAERWYDRYDERVRECKTRKGVRAGIEWAAENAIDRVILSNHTMLRIQRDLIRFGLQDMFLAVLGNHTLESSMQGLNKQERLRKYLEQNDYAKIVIVGDTTEEIHIAQKLGLVSVAVTGGSMSRKRLLQENPDYLITNMKYLPGIISQI